MGSVGSVGKGNIKLKAKWKERRDWKRDED